MADWETFRDIVRTSIELEETLNDYLPKIKKKYGRYLPLRVQQKVENITAKMADNDRLLAELARALVREEDKEKTDGKQEESSTLEDPAAGQAHGR